jgi:Mg-chelatase subunit ChlD
LLSCFSFRFRLAFHAGRIDEPAQRDGEGAAMEVKFSVTLLAAALWATSETPLHASDDKGDVQAVAIVLDCSGSMQELTRDLEPKMFAAKRVVSSLIGSLPARLDVAFAVYGHDVAMDCDAVRVVRPLSPLDETSKGHLRSYVQALKPTGKTPIALALRTIGEEMAKSAKRCQIILVTDGMETCGGDPAKEASDLIARLNLKSIEVVGVGVSAAEAAGVQSIADAGKGKFVNAKTAKELGAAFKSILPVEFPVAPASVVVKKTAVSGIIVKAPPKEFGKLTGIEIYDAGTDLKERNVKPVQYGERAGDPMIVQPGSYDVYVKGWLQSRVLIASGLAVAKNQTVTLESRGLLAGIVIKELGIPGVKVGSIDAVRKGSRHHHSNIVQQVSRLGEVMLVPPDMALDVYLKPWLAEPMQLQSVATKAGELIVIGGDESNGKAQAEPETAAQDRPPAGGTIVVINPDAITDNEKADAEFKLEDARLARVPNDDVASLIGKVESGSEADQLAAAQRLGELGARAKAAVAPLANLVGQRTPSRRELMMMNFGVAGTLTAGPVRIAAVKALYKIDRAAAINALESATQCSHPGVRRWANATLDNALGRAPSSQPPKKRFSEPAGRFKVPGGAFRQ